MRANNRFLSAAGAVVVLAGVGGLGYAFGSKSVPVGVVSHYGAGFLLKEARTMDACGECHDAVDFHTCTTCHDDHGAVEFTDVPFYDLIALTGDVPEPGYVRLDDILPYREQPHTHLPLLDFLAAQGVTSFESVTLVSDDGGFVTIEPANLNEKALLLPYVDGIRFASEDLHVSTWLKGISRIIVVGEAAPLTIGGQATSIGRLLLGPTRSVTVQRADVMLVSEDDGQARKASTATRLDGVSLSDIVGSFETLTITDAAGQITTLSAGEARDALLAAERSGVTLVLPDRGRSQWVEQVVEIETE
jgi:hypothetical protein